MRRRITHRMLGGAALAAMVIVAAALFVPASPASAQVVIDMPPPPRTAPRRAAPPPRPAQLDADPGRTAMQRYARARMLPDHAYLSPRHRHRPFHPDDFTRWWWWGPFPVLGPPTVILVEPTPIIIKKP